MTQAQTTLHICTLRWRHVFQVDGNVTWLHIGAVSSPPVLGRFFRPQVLLPFFEDLKTSETHHVMKPPKSVPGFRLRFFCPAVLLPFLGDKVEKNQ